MRFGWPKYWATISLSFSYSIEPIYFGLFGILTEPLFLFFFFFLILSSSFFPPALSLLIKVCKLLHLAYSPKSVISFYLDVQVCLLFNVLCVLIPPALLFLDGMSSLLLLQQTSCSLYISSLTFVIANIMQSLHKFPAFVIVNIMQSLPLVGFITMKASVWLLYVRVCVFVCHYIL